MIMMLMTKLTLYLDTSHPVLVDSRLLNQTKGSMDYCDSKRLKSIFFKRRTVHGYGLLLA